MICNTLILINFLFVQMIANQLIEPIFDAPIDFQDNSDIEIELNALRRTIPGEPGLLIKTSTMNECEG